jgi:hypothetical protein
MQLEIRPPVQPMASSRSVSIWNIGPASKFKTFAAQIVWWEDFGTPQPEK